MDRGGAPGVEPGINGLIEEHFFKHLFCALAKTRLASAVDHCTGMDLRPRSQTDMQVSR